MRSKCEFVPEVCVVMAFRENVIFNGWSFRKERQYFIITIIIIIIIIVISMFITRYDRNVLAYGDTVVDIIPRVSVPRKLHGFSFFFFSFRLESRS